MTPGWRRESIFGKSCIRWHTPVIPVLRSGKQEDLKAEDSLGYIVLNKSEVQRSKGGDWLPRGSENSCGWHLADICWMQPTRYCVKGSTHTLLTHWIPNLYKLLKVGSLRLQYLEERRRGPEDSEQIAPLDTIRQPKSRATKPTLLLSYNGPPVCSPSPSLLWLPLMTVSPQGHFLSSITCIWIAGPAQFALPTTIKALLKIIKTTCHLTSPFFQPQGAGRNKETLALRSQIWF